MISFETVDFEFKFDEEHLTNWIKGVVKEEGKEMGELSIVLGSDEWLLEKNIAFLDHDFYTDIITFDYSEDGVISGDVLISVERVYDNAEQFNVSRETEFFRVVVHGVLHLLGYKDKTSEESELMRKKEDYYLSLL